MPPIARVFISYQRDPSFMLALHISEKLRQHNIEVFVDAERMDSVGPFPRTLLKEIEASDIFVCLLSDTTLESEWVQREIDHAHTMGRPMIPVFQQSYTAPAEPIAHSVAALLEYQGVHIFEKKGVLVAASIEQLARMIKTMMRPSRRRWLWLAAAFLILVVGFAVFQYLKPSLFGGGLTVTPASTDTPTLTSTLTAEEWMAQGDIEAEEGNYEAAIEAYTQAITLEPDLNSSTYYKLGDAHAAIGELEAAIEDFTRAIELEPTNPVSQIRRGDIYRELGNDEQAVVDYTQAIELDPNAAWGYYNRANAYNYGLQNYALAIADYDRSLELDPNWNPDTYANRGDAHLNIGNNEAAIADYTQALEVNPDSAWANRNRGIAYSGLGQYEPAIVDFLQAIALDATNYDVYAALGDVYYTLGRSEEALAVYHQHVEQAGESAYDYVVQRVAELEAQLGTPTEGVIGIVDGLDRIVRSLPVSYGESLGVVNGGDQLPITGINVDRDYYLVDYNGQMGWISVAFIAEVQGDLSTVPLVSSGVFGTVSGLDRVIRSLPSLSGEYLGFVDEDQLLPITGVTADGDYYRVDYNGQIGWISVELIAEVQGDLSTVPIVSP